MLLAIDVGNTNIVFALMQGQVVTYSWRLDTSKAHEAIDVVDWLDTQMKSVGLARKAVAGAIMSSVVPSVNDVLRHVVADMFEGINFFTIGDEAVRLGIAVLVDNPSEVGADRLVNALAAQQDYDCPLVVVDFGTATTFDVVDETGAYVGGVIAPGIRLSLKALHDAAAKLPLIEPAEPTGGVIGKNTVDAMRSGLFWGYVGMIEGVVERLQTELGQSVKVVATGGLAPTFEGKTRVIDAIDSNLTMKGLSLIYERNVN